MLFQFNKLCIFGKCISNKLCRLKQAQVSMEFILLFVLVFFVFVTVLSVVPDWFDVADTSDYHAKSFINEVKLALITASLSPSDFGTAIIVPTKFKDEVVSIEIHVSPDNLILVKDESGSVIAQKTIPIVDIANNTVPLTGVLHIIKKGDKLCLNSC